MDHDRRLESWSKYGEVVIGPDTPRITLAHGEGGRLMRELLRDRILPRFSAGERGVPEDAVRLPPVAGDLALTTDSYVVSPLFFPGGDIGSLAVTGTVNDLVVSGAKPFYLTLSLIIEEGLPIPVLDKILESVATTARRIGVDVVAGDTKVVPRGVADGLFVNTTGVGMLPARDPVGGVTIVAGDELVVTGPIGRHGIAILCAREELQLEPPPRSDCGSLLAAANRLRDALGNRLRAMRDATRGGVAAVLHEWSEACGLTLSIRESDLPVSGDVRGACELLGLDPLHVANEGTMLVAVAKGAGRQAVELLRDLPGCEQASLIGKVTSRQSSPVTVERMLGILQPLDEPLGAPLPRIC